MEFRNLATFLKIVENNCFSKAAEQLAYSQYTVTIQIQQLEEEYLLRKNEADFAFISYDKRTAKKYEKLFLQEARFVFAAVPTHPLAGKENVTLEEISQYDVIIIQI